MPKPSNPQTNRGVTRSRAPKRRIIADPPLDYDEIARLAHSYWEARGGEGGSPEEDWYRAEAELKARRAAGK